MELEDEDTDNNDISVPWPQGSEGSQELCMSEFLADPFEDSASNAGSRLEPQTAEILKSPQQLKSQEWESATESLPDMSGSEEGVSFQEEDEIYLGESREIMAESPHIQTTSPTSLSPHPQHPEAGQISQPNSESSSSLSCAADMTLALTLTPERPLGARKRQGQGTGPRRVESSEEGGSGEAPPASVFYGISAESAEQAEKWSSESDTDLCRPERQRARSTRIGHNKSKAERQVKENKSKCKRIARLLTDAPNPKNKGALLFRKRRQRVQRYTLVTYGTGVNKLDSEDQIEEEIEELGATGYNCAETSESEFEEECSVYHRQHHLSLNWGSVGEMEELPETKGKGVLMFAQRRKRVDEILSEHEEQRSREGIPMEASTEPERREAQSIHETKEMHEQAKYTDANLKQHVEYQGDTQQTSQQSYVPRPLVPNRTAKPFLGFQDGPAAPVLPGSHAPVTKRREPRFKVPVPIIAKAQVWSPTGDIIASRDERISVPAIKTGILPETKRKTYKQPRMPAKDVDLQNKEGRKSYIESEEDCFSLGAEACNFMQPRRIKLKNPPPVTPKPTINPACPPWVKKSPSRELFISPRSPGSQPSHSPEEPHRQHYCQQQTQQIANRWNQTQASLQTPANAWAPVNSSCKLPVQPTAHSWSQQPQRSTVSMPAHSRSYGPHHPPSQSARSEPDSAPQSVASCPPKAVKAYVPSSKAPRASPKGLVSDRGNNQGEGPTMVGKGAELFSKRQSRVEKFVVDVEKVQANKTRPTSPTVSLPNHWRYSSNVRAPPPLSYNPLLAPFYPPSATKQPPSTSPKIKPKTKEKPKTFVKHRSTVDIMKHQPHQLDSSLFKYDAVPDAKSPNPKPSPASKYEATKCLKHRSAPSHSTHNASESEVPVKSPVSVNSPHSTARKNTRSAELLATDRRLDGKHTVTPEAHHMTNKQAPSARPMSTSSQQSAVGDNIASAFSPGSLIARGARQMAPRPKFSAKKTESTGPHWRPVAMLN